MRLQKWFIKRWIAKSGAFPEALVQAHLDGTFESMVDREVAKILRQERFRRSVAPYVYGAKVLWRSIHGRYRLACAKIYGRSAQPSGGGAGAQHATPVPQAGYAASALSALGTGFAGQVGAGSGSNAAPTISRLGPIKDDGIVAGEIVAYRCWRLRPDGKLSSVYQSGTVWEPGQPLEGDTDQDSEGVHAFKRRIDLASYGFSYNDPTTIVVSGAVALWGQVVEHERGYRAARAEIREIDDSPDYDAEAIRKTYGIDKPKKSV